MRSDVLGGLYRTRINCPNGVDEAFYGGSVVGERPECNSIAWPGGGGYILYRQAFVGDRACVPNFEYPVPNGTCFTGCSRDTSPSVFMVRAILQPFAGNAVVNGCISVVRTIEVAVDVVSSRLASQYCRCNPGYVFTDILSADTSATFVNYCCPQNAASGVRGTYERISPDPPDVTVKCYPYRGDPLTITPVKWPRTLTVS